MFLRVFATLFFQVLDIASMSLFLMALDCQVGGVAELATHHPVEAHSQHL